MEGFPIIHLRGQLGSLGNTVIQRLLREKVEIVLSTDDFEEANEKFSVDLEFSQSRIVSSEDCKIDSGHRIVLFGFQGYFSDHDDVELGIEVDGAEVILITPSVGIDIDTSEIDSHIIVHDMIPHRSEMPWNNQFLDDIMDSLIDGSEVLEKKRNSRFLVAELDVADAVSRLLISNNPIPSLIDISGRRGWDDMQIYQELKILYNRTIAGQTGEFSAENLTSPSTPNIELLHKDEVVAESRPRLEVLHKALTDSGFEGWRPTIPIRTALMYFLIGKLK